jgi:hypothetical protein
MKIRFDDDIFEAPDARGIVVKIIMDSWFGERTVQGYMDGYAERRIIYDGATIPTGSPEEFLAALAQLGTIEVLEE